jgi:hypothetical protein
MFYKHTHKVNEKDMMESLLRSGGTIMHSLESTGLQKGRTYDGESVNRSQMEVKEL